MTYDELRPTIRTGDVFLVEGRKFFSWLIRVCLGQQFSHVALAWWWNDGLYIAEFVEGTGFEIMPVSQWLTLQSGKIYLGRAPKVVENRPFRIIDYIHEYRADKGKQGYGYLSLLKVFVGQLTGKQIAVKRKVCSTFVQGAWQAAGYQCDDTESPGGIFEQCRVIVPIG